MKQGVSPDEARLEQPHTHSIPTNLALFRHKITLYRFNQGGSCYCRGLKWEQGAEPPGPLTLTTVFNCGSDEGRKKFVAATGVDATRSSATSPCVPQTVVDRIKTPTSATSPCVHKKMPDGKLGTRPAV